MKKYQETVIALEAENPEFLLLWNATDKVLYNHFIETADENGIRRYETLLKIYPASTDTLEARRTRVRNRWFYKIPYTIKVLLEKLTQLFSGEHHFSITGDFKTSYECTISVFTLDDNSKTELNHLLTVMMPANMSFSVFYESVNVGNLFFGGLMEAVDIIEIKQR